MILEYPFCFIREDFLGKEKFFYYCLVELIIKNVPKSVYINNDFTIYIRGEKAFFM